jgi:hypothetical protein
MHRSSPQNRTHNTPSRSTPTISIRHHQTETKPTAPAPTTIFHRDKEEECTVTSTNTNEVVVLVDISLFGNFNGVIHWLTSST